MARPPINERGAETPPDFKKNLEGILAKQLTPKNSAKFFDEMLAELIALVARATALYQSRNPTETAKGAELENKALESLGFAEDEVHETLSRVAGMQEDMKTAMEEIDRRITAIEVEDEIIVPPDSRTVPRGGNAETDSDEGRLLQRLRVLLYVLQNEGITVSDPTHVELHQGTVEGIRREASYTKAVVPELNRTVLVCDHQGNRTFVFDTTKLAGVLSGNQDVRNMTKEELGHLLHTHPGVGVSFAYSSNWAERLRVYLKHEIEAEVNEEMSTPALYVASGELDPWRGFWKDPVTETYWGSVRGITEKLNTILPNPISRDVVDTRINKAKPPLPSKRIHDLVGRPQTMYPYETVLSLVDDYKTTPPVAFETEGIWKGFHVAPDGTHFASTQVIENKLKEEGFDVPKGGVYTVVRDKQKRPFRKFPVLPGGSTSLRTPHNAYCYEEVKPYFANRPPYIASGEWEGFFLGKNGQHYGSRAILARKLGISETGFKNRLKAHMTSLSTEEIGRTNSDKTYSFEEVEPLLREFLALAPVMDSGPWSGFLEVEDPPGTKKHHGPANTIARRILSQLPEANIVPLGTLNGRVGRIIEDNAAVLDSVELRDISGAKHEHAYAYEDVKKLYFEKFKVQ